MVKLIIEIDEKLRKRFKTKLFKEGLSIREVLTSYIKEYSQAKCQKGTERGS